MLFIGVRGHRGAGKTTISYLLGNTIDWLLSNVSNGNDVNMEHFKNTFHYWCDDIINSEKAIYNANLNYVYFDNFSDTLKTFISLLIGCDQEYMYSDYHKDHMVVNLKNFSYKIYDEIPSNIKLYTHEELYKSIAKDRPPVTMTKNIFMTLRDLIMYFGQEVMQRFFGLNVWVKTLKSPQSIFNDIYEDYNSNDKLYRIFCDVKTSSEVTYIKDKKGVIVQVNRPSGMKVGKDKLVNDNRVDYTINIKDNLYDTAEQILDIAKQIIQK